MATTDPLTGIRYIEGPDGRRGIWTGAGYDYSIPQSVAADSIQKRYRSGDGRDIYDTYDQAFADRYTRDDSGTFRGDPRTEYSLSEGPWSSWDSRNYFSDFDESGNLNALQIKNEDKYAARVPYIKDASGNFVPDWSQMTKVEHNTNIEPMDYAPLAILAAFGGAAALGAGAAGSTAGGAAGSAGGAGVGAAEALWPGLAGAGGGGVPGGYAGLIGTGAAPSGAALGAGGTLSGGLGGMLGGFGDYMSLAPQLGEAMYGPPETSYAPGESPGAYTNEKPWYSDLLPDWKDLLKQGIKQYMGSQGQSAGGSGVGGGGYNPAGGGSGSQSFSGTPSVGGQVPLNQLPTGGLIPPGASNPVSDQANLLAESLMKKRNGAMYG